ncbi:hypothetical protein OPV22_016454 [Ensete ventricosum]|uniref:Uncharacterized protein n=1 Tax=Ensete ventricosum TaxID=4639 RepID=A0AAV8QL48_ENSVE|nr:hypothetical protein OPV22_016454 [Ensete ventricosum]
MAPGFIFFFLCFLCLIRFSNSPLIAVLRTHSVGLEGERYACTSKKQYNIKERVRFEQDLKVGLPLLQSEVAREVLMNYDGKERLTAEAINEQMVQDVPINEAGKGLSAEAIPETVKAEGNDVPPEQDQHHLETLIQKKMITQDMSRLDILVEIAASVGRIAGPSTDKDASKIAITTPIYYLTMVMDVLTCHRENKGAARPTCASECDHPPAKSSCTPYPSILTRASSSLGDVANQSFEKDVDHKPANPGMTYYFRRKKRQPDLQKAIARDQAS